MMWPLGGLAERRYTARAAGAYFITAAAGPAVNLLLAGLCAFLLAFATDLSYQPLWNPLTSPFRIDPSGAIRLWTWDGQPEYTLSRLADCSGPTVLGQLGVVSAQRAACLLPAGRRPNAAKRCGRASATGKRRWPSFTPASSLLSWSV